MSSSSSSCSASAANVKDGGYKTWSHEDLIARVTQLEAELKAQNNKFTSVFSSSSSSANGITRSAHPTSHTETASGKQKRKKTNSSAATKPPFDPANYHTRRIALKFAYLGAKYNGFEHHVGNTTPLPTIEEELWKALVKTRLIFPEVLYGSNEEKYAGAEGNGVGDGSSGAVSEELLKRALSGRAEDFDLLPKTVVGDWRGCGYSKCGRTDRGVSAFGQVIGITVRSARPKRFVPKTNGTAEPSLSTAEDEATESSGHRETYRHMESEEIKEETPFDDIKDELSYIALINRVLPPEIRILAWCPRPPSNFDARFSCKERKYRYFFTQPAFIPLPGGAGLSKTGQREGWLDIGAMQEAASYLVGSHDYRNLCKVDASKQLTNFTRRITAATIERVTEVSSPDFVASLGMTGVDTRQGMELYTFDVQGSAFLWHQVRCMVAVLFLVGQGLEPPSVVRDLLDAETNPRKPMYDMASDQPLVLWDCMFSVDPGKGKFEPGERPASYIDRGVGQDELEWVYAADAEAGASSSSSSSSQTAMWGPLGLMPELWKGWRKAKMDEVLAAQLLDLVFKQGATTTAAAAVATANGNGCQGGKEAIRPAKDNQRVFEGHDSAVPRGRYAPLMKKPLMDPVEVINDRWLARKSLTKSDPQEKKKKKEKGEEGEAEEK